MPRRKAQERKTHADTVDGAHKQIVLCGPPTGSGSDTAARAALPLACAAVPLMEATSRRSAEPHGR